MSEQTVACIDGSNVSQSVCNYAAWSTLRLANSMVLLNVLDDVRTPTDVDFSGNRGVDTRQSLLLELAEIEEKRAKLARRQGLIFLDAAERQVKQNFQNLSALVTQQRHGDLVDTLLEMEPDTRLFVIGKQGRHGEGIGQHIGHQVERVIRAATRPVWVISENYVAPQKIMLATDGSPTAQKATEMLATSPLFKELPIEVVMVGAENTDNKADLDWALTRLREAGFDANATLLQGDVEDALLEFAEDHQVDCIVMGAYGHSRIREFFVGSHTNRMLMRCKLPLLLLR